MAWGAIGLATNMPGIGTAETVPSTGLLHGASDTRARYTYYSEVVDDDTRVAALHRGRDGARVGITTAHALDAAPGGRGWLPQRMSSAVRERIDWRFERWSIFNPREGSGRPLGPAAQSADASGSMACYFEHTAGLADPNRQRAVRQPLFRSQELDEFVGRRTAPVCSQPACHWRLRDEQLLLASSERCRKRKPRADHRHESSISACRREQIERWRAGRNRLHAANLFGTSRLDESGPQDGAGAGSVLGAERFERRHHFTEGCRRGILVAGGSIRTPSRWAH